MNEKEGREGRKDVKDIKEGKKDSKEGLYWNILIPPLFPPSLQCGTSSCDCPGCTKLGSNTCQDENGDLADPWY